MCDIEYKVRLDACQQNYVTLMCDTGDFMDGNNYRELLNKLREARYLKKNWYIVASLTEKIRESVDGPRRKMERVEGAAEVSGYNINTLNRMLGVKSYFDSVKDSVPGLAVIDPNDLSFPTLEVIKRWHQLDSNTAKETLIEVLAERITYRALREKYNSFVAANTSSASAHQVARLVAKDFKEAALKAVQQSIALFVDEGGSTTVKISSGYSVATDALIYVQHSIEPVAGMEFVLIREQRESKNSLEEIMQRTVFNASFYDRYWIVFASTIGTGSNRIEVFCSLLDELDRSSIGVAVLPWGDDIRSPSGDNSIRIKRSPTADPNPDWRNKLAQFEKTRSALVRYT